MQKKKTQVAFGRRNLRFLERARKGWAILKIIVNVTSGGPQKRRQAAALQKGADGASCSGLRGHGGQPFTAQDKQ